MPDNRNSGFLVRGPEQMPLQIPKELIEAEKALGIKAVMVWINMAFFVQQNKPVNIKLISEAMDLSQKEVNRALTKLADFGWINDEGYEIRLCIPHEKSGESVEEIDIELLDPKQKGFEWLINFWANRIAPPTPEEMKKLLFWVEQKQVSYEVIAVAIEEMCASISQPNFGYLEGVLRNWVNEGVFTYEQLLEKPYLTKILRQPQMTAIHPEAERKWKEFFSDEFDA